MFSLTKAPMSVVTVGAVITMCMHWVDCEGCDYEQLMAQI